MKSVNITAIVIAFFLFSTFIMADETTLSIDAQIEAIKHAPPQKRVEMMNALKQRLAAMNQEERAKIIAQMRAKMQKNSMLRHNTHKTYDDTNRAHDMAQEQQLQMQQKMSQMQNMSQKQAGDQHSHENMQSTMPPIQQQHNNQRNRQPTNRQYMNDNTQKKMPYEDRGGRMMNNRTDHHR